MNTSLSQLKTHKTKPRAIKYAKERGFQSALWEAFCIAVDSIQSHKLRSVLTLLGVMIGVASVVTVGGAIEGLGFYVSDRLVSTLGSNAFIVSRIARTNISSEEYEKLNKRNKRIYPDDMNAVKDKCDGCVAISPRLRRRDEVKRGNNTFFEANISGVSADLPLIQTLEVAEGRFISSFDVIHTRPYAVIGADIQKELFRSTGVLGKKLKVGGDSFTVIGVEKQNGSFFGQSMDNNIYIPYTAFLKKYGSRQSILFHVKAPSADALEATQDEVRQIMRSRHKLRPSEEDDFDILASEALQETVSEFIGNIAMVITPITLISLIVGGIVIMNIMLVTVTERTNEIGMRKAVGARRSDILLQFLVESALLASIGGTLGILAAYGLGFIIGSTTPVPIDVTPGYIILAILTSGGIGLISGIYPAHKASKLDPIVALSRE